MSSSSGMSGTIDLPQSPTHFFNTVSTAETSGRSWGFRAYCSTHVATNRFHNASESPEGGLSGRPPFATLSITVSFRRTLANGTRPVITYQKVRSVFSMLRARTDLKDRHPDRIDICVLRGKLFLKFSGEPECLGVQQLWGHPSNRALLFTDSGSRPAR